MKTAEDILFEGFLITINEDDPEKAYSDFVECMKKYGKQCYEQGAADGTPWIKITPETIADVIRGKWYQVCNEKTGTQYIAYRNVKAQWRLGDGREVRGITHFSELKRMPKTE